MDKQGIADKEKLFCVFWSCYPRKDAKKAAKKAWAKIKVDDILLKQMLETISWQKKTKQWKEGYIPMPATWLNGERWEDEEPKKSRPRQQEWPVYKEGIKQQIPVEKVDVHSIMKKAADGGNLFFKRLLERTEHKKAEEGSGTQVAATPEPGPAPQVEERKVL